MIFPLKKKDEPNVLPIVAKAPEKRQRKEVKKQKRDEEIKRERKGGEGGRTTHGF